MPKYPLCEQTVTLYRREKGQIFRRVLEDCFYKYTDTVENDRFVRKFLLVVPGAEALRPGDRVLEGIGPETVNWEKFLPVNVPGLSQAEYAEPHCFLGTVHHWEAGR